MSTYDCVFTVFKLEIGENGRIVGVTTNLWYILDEASSVFKHL